VVVSARTRPISRDDFARAFAGAGAERYLPILSPAQLADLLGLSVKTVYEWLAKGRLDGAFRKRGKHNLIWRDRALDILLNGKEWKYE
jgi:excisionase family DNA binding protein